MSALRIITTSDGSSSIMNEELNETYHSVHGAVRESTHVFIENGLDHYIRRSGATEVSVLEIGFGTGLNAWLSMQYATRHGIPLRYESVEAFPLHEEMWSALNYAQDPGRRQSFAALHQAPWGSFHILEPGFSLKKVKAKLEDLEFASDAFDVIYFDAFAPARQPEMWSYSMLAKTAVALKRSGVFVTYCAKGQVRRDLSALNLAVERLPGPPGKKEMIRALKI